MLLMLCAGATEAAVAQWASAFAEQGLNVSKTIGDLAGPMAFAVLMGFCRVFYAKNLGRISLEKFLFIGAIGCVFSYLLTTLPPVPGLNLVGCALCGLFVGILWPGTYSLASKAMPYGGTLMFALLALAGDIGCMTGPVLVGMVSDLADNALKIGILAAIVFPLLAVFGSACVLKKKSLFKIASPVPSGRIGREVTPARFFRLPCRPVLCPARPLLSLPVFLSDYLLFLVFLQATDFPYKNKPPCTKSKPPPVF